MDEKVLDFFKRRRSVRRFRPDPVPQGLIDTAVEAAIWAPRAGNRRHWRLISVESPDLRARMTAAVEKEIERQRAYVKSERALGQFNGYTAHFTNFRSAPVLLVLVAKRYDSIYTRIVAKIPGVSMGEDFDPGMASALMAAENLLLAASALGLGTCFLSGPLVAHEELKNMLGLDRGERLAGVVAMGYPEASAVEETGTHSRQERPKDVVSRL